MHRWTDKVVKDMMDLEEIPKLDYMIPYCLTHTYDQKVRRFYVQAPYAGNLFWAICAYIQFECSEMEETYSMDQTEVIEILEKFYGCEKTKRTKANQVDLYINWEAFCGTGLQEVKCLRRNGMEEYFTKYIKEFEEGREARKAQ